MLHHAESMRKAAELNSDYAVVCGNKHYAFAAIRGNWSDIYTDPTVMPVLLLKELESTEGENVCLWKNEL